MCLNALTNFYTLLNYFKLFKNSLTPPFWVIPPYKEHIFSYSFRTKSRNVQNVFPKPIKSISPSFGTNFLVTFFFPHYTINKQSPLPPQRNFKHSFFLSPSPVAFLQSSRPGDENIASHSASNECGQGKGGASVAFHLPAGNGTPPAPRGLVTGIKGNLLLKQTWAFVGVDTSL